jgi:uncharacterized membrane protein
MGYNPVNVGLLIILIGFIIVILGTFTQSSHTKGDSKFAIGGFIGFIPFGFGNDKKLTWFLLAFMAIAMILFYLMNILLQTKIK